MSRIYEALRTVEAKRSLSGARDRDSLGVMEMTERRRSRRWELDVPLTVYGHGSGGSPFYQEAEAINAGAEGALLLMRAPACEGQELLLINNYSSKEQLCRIVRVRSRDTETNEVGVTFPWPNPEFWHVPDTSCNLSKEPADEGF
jgi:hypothetical protein